MASGNIALTISPEEELANLKTQFLASLNHEVRTPLTGIVGMTDLLLETALSEEQNEYVAAVRRCAGDLLAVFNKTLEFSDLAAGRVVLEQDEFHLPEAIRSAVSAHTSAAADKGLKLICDFTPAVPETAIGDTVRLGQLVSHLVENAVKFTERGAVEVLTSSRLEDGVLQLNIRVKDTGIGIPSDKLTTVFESFRQVDGGLGRAYGGLGLGLPLVQKLLVLMGGCLSVESGAGVGTEFSVTVPLRPSGDSPRPLVQDALSARETGFRNGRRILLVEDDDVAQRVVVHVLRRAGYDPKRASSGPDAIEAVSKDRFDLILMDLQMPQMDGLTATARIREVPGCASTPIVALTANVTDEHRRLCLSSGMKAFVSKPVQAKELLGVLETVLT